MDVNLLSDDEKKEYEILKNAEEFTSKAYADDPCPKNKKAWDLAKKSLDSVVDKYKSKYDFEDDYSFKDALIFLQKRYKVKKSKFYADIQKKYIVSESGRIKSDDLLQYAKSLKTKDVGDVGELHEKKLKKEIERLEQQVERLKFENEKESGKYVLVSDFERELAARVAVFEVTLRNMFSENILSWTEMLVGDQKMIPVILKDMNNKLDDALNIMASTDKYQVNFIGA